MGMSDPIEVPDGMVHVGWFCHHEPSRYDADKKKIRRPKPHRKWGWKRGEKVGEKDHGTISSITLLERERPACPLAVPVFAQATSDSVTNLMAGVRHD
ncbi:hypothetical protein GS937_22945 [Rhodococcus hoagii]|nr:hypothetical protein [Prescottella equi]NKW66704.1 hypothetical protein [Prescottella equi]